MDVPSIAREEILGIGYRRGKFNGRTCAVVTNFSEFDHAQKLTTEGDMRAEELDELTMLDNLTVFGFASRNTDTLMLLPIWLAHALVRRLDQVRKRQRRYLAPDGKYQVGTTTRPDSIVQGWSPASGHLALHRERCARNSGKL
ncbi:MAG: hypothetical protein ACK2UO_06415 [Caldilineaceae bacterium]